MSYTAVLLMKKHDSICHAVYMGIVILDHMIMQSFMFF